MLGTGVCGGVTAASSAAVDGCGVVALCGTEACKSACNVGKHRVYTTAHLKVDLISHSTKIKPFSGQ